MSADRDPAQVHQEIHVAGDARAYVVGVGSLVVNVRDDPADPHGRRLVETYERHSRQELLRGMTQLVRERAAHTLAAAVTRAYGAEFHLPVTFAYAPHVVDGRALRPWERPGVQVEHRSVQAVADASGGLLVIAGPAGAGKSTLLHQLAEALTRAAAAPVDGNVISQLPLLLPVASRFEAQQFGGTAPKSFLEWVTRQAEIDFRVPARTVRAWLETGQIYLLLDDMNALGDEERETFVTELIGFHRSCPGNHIVLATRTEDLTSVPVRLPFHAVEVEAPSAEAVSAALAGSPVNAVARELLRTPLDVAAAALASHTAPAVDLDVSDAAELRERVIGSYVDHVLAAEDVRQEFDPPTARRYAGSLAALMAEHHKAFVVGVPDPRWIGGTGLRRLIRYGPRLIGYPLTALLVAGCGYLLGGWLVALVAAATAMLLMRLTFFSPEGLHDPYEGLRGAPGRTRREFIGRRLFDFPVRLTALAAEGLLVAWVVARAIQSPTRSGLSMAAIVVASGAYLCYQLLTRSVPADPDQYEDLSSGRDPMRWRTFGVLTAAMAFAIGVVGAICGLLLGLLINWGMARPGVRATIETYRALDQEPWGHLNAAALSYLDAALAGAPLGRWYLEPAWPWLCAALVALMVILPVATLFLAAGVASSLAPAAISIEDRLPPQYRAFLDHLVRTTLMIKLNGRYSFNHPLIADFLRRSWTSPG
ncbi:NACHT domain-containing protein [Actinoplanes sp. NBC_00393]|uniref:AAA family ATPase n=1 Tax=Actinoplanes sp. NBC_00393 TaxID=2975953 RepID=UPI002E1B6D5C